MIVGADGRDSQVARLGGFERRADPDELLAAGLLVQGEMETGDAINAFIAPTPGQIAAVTRIASGLYRLYLFHHIDAIPSRLSGDRDVELAFSYLRAAGMPGEWLADARPKGPLATFDGTHRWIEQPYKDGVVLIGDAAGASDPSWGSGLARSLRDVRLLRDMLVSVADWRRAADEYAGQHDEYWDRLRDIERLAAKAMMSALTAPRAASALSRFSIAYPNWRPGRTAPRRIATTPSAHNSWPDFLPYSVEAAAPACRGRARGGSVRQNGAGVLTWARQVPMVTRWIATAASAGRSISSGF